MLLTHQKFTMKFWHCRYFQLFQKNIKIA